MSSEADLNRVRHMVDSARQAVEYCNNTTQEGLSTDPPGQSLLIRSLEILGEAAAQTSEGFRADRPNIPWRQMIATRNRLIHGYFDVDLAIVWRTVTERLPEVIDQLVAILTESDDV